MRDETGESRKGWFHHGLPEVQLEGPLGSPGNPVRSNGPWGQRDYLSRLRCGNRLPPMYQRLASMGRGPYGTIMDLYLVECEREEPRHVYLDFYHCVVETAPIPGLAMDDSAEPIELSQCEEQEP